MVSPSLVWSINICFVYHLEWISSDLPSISSCLYMIWCGQSFIGLIRQQLCRAASGMDFFIYLVHQQLFCTSSGMDSFRSVVHQQLFVHHLVWVVLHWQHPSTVVSCIIWYGFYHLPHPSAVASCIWNWYSSSVSSINSCFVHHLVCKILPFSDPSTVVSYIIWHGFLQSSHPSTVVCTSSGMGSPSLVSSINSCFVHHLVWISSSVSSIHSCFVHYLAWTPSSVSSVNIWVHHLAWVVVRWSHPSTIDSYFIWYGFLIVSSINCSFVLHLVWVVVHWLRPSTVVSCIIWHGCLQLSNPSTVVLYIIWYG